MMTGHWEWLLVLLAVLVLFGAKRLPELARSLGRSIGEFRKGRREGEIEGASDPKIGESAKSKDETPAP